MARVTAPRLLALVALLVVVTADVALFSHLLPTMRASLVPPRAAATPANPPTAETAAPEAAGPTPVVTRTFRLVVPAGFQLANVGTNDASLFLGDHATTDGLEGVQVSAKREPHAVALGPAIQQSQQLGRLETAYGTVGTCVAPRFLRVGGVRGKLTGYLYSVRRTTTPGPTVCDVYWFGTNSAKNVAYSFEDAAQQSEYPAFAPRAARVRDSVVWLV